MKRVFHLQVLAATLSVCSASQAQAQPVEHGEVARVVSSTAVLQQVGTPRQVCVDEVITTPGQKSGVGAAMGGVAGGAIGNQIGGGSGRAVATVVGVIGGAMLGNQIEGPGNPTTQTVPHCTTEMQYETRTTGYNVTYEYAGKQYMIQMPYDPGPTLPVRVTPVLRTPHDR